MYLDPSALVAPPELINVSEVTIDLASHFNEHSTSKVPVTCLFSTLPHVSLECSI